MFRTLTSSVCFLKLVLQNTYQGVVVFTVAPGKGCMLNCSSFSSSSVKPSRLQRSQPRKVDTLLPLASTPRMKPFRLSRIRTTREISGSAGSMYSKKLPT